MPSALTCGCEYSKVFQAPSCLIFHRRSHFTAVGILPEYAHVIGSAQLGLLGSMLAKKTFTIHRAIQIGEKQICLKSGA
jgi:hypothetical protein